MKWGADIGNVGLKAAGSRFVTFPLFDLLSTSILNLCDMVQDVRHRSSLRSEAQQVSILLLHLAL